MAAHSGPPAPYDQEPRKRSGCLVALYVLFGVGLFGLVVGGIGVWAFLQTEQGQKTLNVAKQGAEWILVASQAPGTEELRASGCEAAMVSKAGSAVDIFMTLVTEEEKQAEIRSELENQTGEGDLDELLMVVCTLPRFSVGDPGCEEVAQTYANAVDSAPDNFFVLVTKQGESELGCQGIYNGDGVLIRQPELP